MLAISEAGRSTISGAEGHLRHFPRSAALQVLAAWALVATTLVLVALPRILHLAPDDPDDFMRLAEVRDLLAGQSWFDVHQYRMGGPTGADMHWSRLVDLPIAAFLAFFRLFLAEPQASALAMTATPLLQLLLAIAVVRALLRDLGAGDGAMLAGMAIIPLFPLLLTNFLPTRIDHHGWQALGSLVGAWLMVRGGRCNALLAGAVAALWLSVSLEGLPLAAVLGGLFALRFWLTGERDHEAYLAGLAVTGPVLFALTRPLSMAGVAYCDLLSWPHFAAFAAAAALAFAGRAVTRGEGRTARLLSLVPVAGAAGALIVIPLGACAVNPFAGFDPVLKFWWLDNVGEGLPLTRQPPSIVAMLLWTPLLVVAGWRVARRAATPPQRERWTLLALLALAAAGYSLMVMRAGLAAQLLAVPFAAVLLADLLPRARALAAPLPRVAATIACLLLATPTFPSAALKPFDAWAEDGTRSHGPLAAASPVVASGKCDLSQLTALPRAKLFAPLDLGPEILVRTPHSVVMSGYHRNQQQMRLVFEGFSGPLAEARGIVRATGSKYLVACASSARLAVYSAAGPDNLADRIVAGRVPGWLTPVPGFEKSPLRVYKVS